MAGGSQIDGVEGATDVSIRELFAAIEDALCIIEILPDDLGRVTDVRYVAVNPAFTVHSGEPSVEGRTASEAFPGLESHWFDHFARVWRSGESARFIDRSDSLGRWFEVSLSRIGGFDRRRVACLFRDVTREHRAKHRALEMVAEQRFPMSA